MSDDSSAGVTSEVRNLPRNPQRTAAPRALRSLHAASMRAGLDGLSTRLAELYGWLAADLAAIEADLDALARARTGDLAARAAAHLLGQRGKRIRPICVLLGARLAGAPIDDRTRALAVACELVHAATLLHDDVIDEGDERRGAPAARVVFGNSASILAGDYLLIEALERVQRSGRPDLLVDLLATIAQMVAAEALQLERRGALDPSRDLYLRIVDGKTASLFRWALCAGARLGELDDNQHAALAAVGMSLGRAFQLIDDALDLEGDPAVVGKDLFADLEQGKLTWPMLIAAEHDRTILAALGEIAGPAASARDVQAIVERIRAAGGIEAAKALARQEQGDATSALALLPEGAARATLEAVIVAAVQRST